MTEFSSLEPSNGPSREFPAASPHISDRYRLLKGRYKVTKYPKDQRIEEKISSAQKEVENPFAYRATKDAVYQLEGVLTPQDKEFFTKYLPEEVFQRVFCIEKGKNEQIISVPEGIELEQFIFFQESEKEFLFFENEDVLLIKSPEGIKSFVVSFPLNIQPEEKASFKQALENKKLETVVQLEQKTAQCIFDPQQDQFIVFTYSLSDKDASLLSNEEKEALLLEANRIGASISQITAENPTIPLYCAIKQEDESFVFTHLEIEDQTRRALLQIAHDTGEARSNFFCVQGKIARLILTKEEENYKTKLEFFEITEEQLEIASIQEEEKQKLLKTKIDQEMAAIFSKVITFSLEKEEKFIYFNREPEEKFAISISDETGEAPVLRVLTQIGKGFAKEGFSIAEKTRDYIDSHAQVFFRMAGQTFQEQERALFKAQEEVAALQKFEHPDIIALEPRTVKALKNEVRVHIAGSSEPDFTEVQVGYKLKLYELGTAAWYLDQGIAPDEESGEIYQRLGILLSATRATQHIHSFPGKYAHMDIKLANIFLTQGPVLIRAVLGDINPKPEGEKEITTAGVYLPPEQGAMKAGKSSFFGSDQGSDIWALGLTYYEIMYGKAPYPAAWEDIKKAPPYVSMQEYEKFRADIEAELVKRDADPRLRSFNTLIREALTMDPSARIKSAELLARLETIVEEFI